jgi:acyl-CoA synthetase (NDP forming)
MESQDPLVNQIDEILHPNSVAIVGVPREMKVGKLFLISLLDQKYPGELYLVNPNATEIDGITCYPDISSIPGKIDLVILLIPNFAALAAIKECAAKGVKGVVLFTAGFKETGTQEGANLEREIVQIAQAANMRLIGPNGMGFYVPKSGLSFIPGLSKQIGPISVVSHSGSLANILCRMSPQKGIYFNKVISLGNECDLKSSDFFHYFANDEQSKVIGAYIEGISEGKKFIESIKSVASVKPVVLWKVGLTKEGERAAASHTGALGSSKEVWSGMMSQFGVTTVSGFEAWVDMLLGFMLLPQGLGKNIAIISGPGGLAVSAAEACGKEGLALADISTETAAKLAEFVPPTGTSLKNPIDVGMSASLNININIEAARLLAADPGVDAILLIGAGMDEEANQVFKDEILKLSQESAKAFVFVSFPGFYSSFEQSFCESGIPAFESVERALRVYARVRKYQKWRANN